MALFAGCKGDESLKEEPATEGLPATISLELNVPASQKVVVSRGVQDIESEIKELLLICYSQTSGRKMVLDLTDKLTSASNTVATGQRTYNLSSKIDALSGTYKVYAVANFTGVFGGLTADALKEMTETELKNTLTKAQEVLEITQTERYPMSSVTDDVTIESGDNVKNTLSLKLTRLTSHIEFVFKNGSNSTTSNVKFTPKSYQVFYLPKNANLFPKDDNTIENGEYFHQDTPVSVTSQSFDFCMLENVRPNASSITGYHQRDDWDKSKGTNPKTFLYAPDNATYVVVKGDYEDSKYHGEVTYTIHLGNFADKTSYGNFTVNRNEHHTYTVTVNGVNSIVAEVDVDNPQEKQPGAEGNLVTKSNTFVLDSHYETVMIQLSQADIDQLATGKVRISSPANNWGNTEKLISALTDEDDYKWIQFQKPTSTTEFPIYKGRSGGVRTGTLNDGLAYLKEFAENPSTYCYYNTSNQTYYTTAFVDEYVYDNLDVDKYVNVDNREMIINLGNDNVSDDKQTSLVTAYSVELTQRSIKTTYTLPSDINIFGIETWDETGDVNIFNQTYYSLSLTDGYANTTRLMSEDGNKFTSSNAYYKTCGYLNKITDNLKSHHVWTLSAGNALKACLSRNRDFNGNGIIDASELEWYLPAMQQYITIWLGEGRLREDTQLFDTELFNNSTYTANTDKNYSKLFTSSDDNNVVYWPDQGASISNRTAVTQAANNSSHWFKSTHGIRCCRNLNASHSVSTAADLPYTVNTSTRVITVANIENERTKSFTGFYDFHFERGNENLLPNKFEVRSSALSVTLTASSLNLNSKGQSAVSEYLNNTVQTAMTNNGISLNEGWRIPNQRELLLAYQCGLLGTSTQHAFSCTWYTAYKANPVKPYPFKYTRQSGGLTAFNCESTMDATLAVNIWLVRDVQ